MVRPEKPVAAGRPANARVGVLARQGAALGRC